MIKSVLFLITSLLLLTSCWAKHEYVIIATPEDTIYTSHLKDHFKDGTPVEFFEIVSYGNEEDYFLLREGHHSNGDCRLSRTRLELGKHGFFYMKLSDESDICIAKGCEHCDFDKDKGCLCADDTVRQSARCEHERIKNVQLLSRY